MRPHSEGHWELSWQVYMKLSCRLYLSFVSIVWICRLFFRLRWELSRPLYLSFVSVVCICRLPLPFVLGVEFSFVSVVCFCRLHWGVGLSFISVLYKWS